MAEEQAQATVEAPVEAPAGDEGKAPVEFESPETEKRFKRVYFHMKQNERISEQMAADNRKLVERLEKMEQETVKKSSSDRLTQLRAEEKTAMEEADYEKASSIREQITDLKVDSKVAQPTKQVEEPWLTPAREEYMVEWASEQDAKGTLLRPWADPEHEDHAKMVKLAEDMVKRDPNIALVTLLDHWEMEAKKHAPKPARSGAAVLGASGDIRPKAISKSLSEDEKLISRRMYPTLPPKDAEARYHKAKEKHL